MITTKILIPVTMMMMMMMMMMTMTTTTIIKTLMMIVNSYTYFRDLSPYLYIFKA